MEEINDKINVDENKSKIDEKEPYKFSNLKNTENKESETNIDFILDLPLDITVELGHTKMKISDLLKLGQGSIIELGKEAGTSFDILANKKLIAKGEVVIVNEKYGIRLTEVINPFERVESLR
jgi:flagellar motor switch protein FliN/FliY